MKIHKLSPEIVSLISAGEVIERPAFAIKELIENALDARSSQINILIEDSGFKKIQVSDNGEGMIKEDLEECFKPHTTSKISEDSNLEAIESFGFRGEALSSLSAVSDLKIKSKTIKEQLGYEINIKNGKLVSERITASNIGTTITADNLFKNTPVRLKFLKSKLTELRHIIDTVSYFALSNPNVSFILVHNKKTLLNFPKVENKSFRINQFFNDSFKLLIPVKKEDSYIKINGFISKPQFNTQSITKQFIFINNRKVNDKLITLAIKESYGNMLEEKTLPVFVLFINIPYELVDVNIHPRKEQVRLHNSDFIFSTIKQLISEVLNENNLTFTNLSWSRVGVGSTKSYAADYLRKSILDNLKVNDIDNNFIFQFNNLYIILPTEQGLLLTDQHAGDERIIFEKLRQEYLKIKDKKIILPKPLILNFNPSEILILKEYKKKITKSGINFKIKNNTIILESIPFILKDRNPYEFLRGLIENKSFENIDTITSEMLAFLACRSAVKAGDKLTGSKMLKILNELKNIKNNATCPHGRPTQVIIQHTDINRLFKR